MTEPGQHDEPPKILCRKWFNYYRAVFYWLRKGFWCRHPKLTAWQMVDLGRNKVRYCEDCAQTDWVW